MAEEHEYRHALQQAERALMHAQRCIDCSPAVGRLVKEARAEVSRVLDIGRDESNEMVLT